MSIEPDLLQPNYAPAPSNAPNGHPRPSFLAFDIVVASMCVALAGFVLCFFCSCKGLSLRRREEEEDDDDYTFGKCATAWSLADVERATDNFSPRRLLGRSRYGAVYRGILPDGRVIAVKRIDPAHVLLKAGTPNFNFAAEITALSRACHPNLVRLKGYCEAPAERIMVMDYFPGRSLQYHLHEGGTLLDWPMRAKIAVEAAKGLEYLHWRTLPYIIHGDFKPSNILLDNTRSARVGEFGLRFLAPPNQMVGTVGYLDPEYYTRGNLAKASDVFSFGVVLFELLSGRPCLSGAQYIVDWVAPLLNDSRVYEIFDPKLGVPSDPNPLFRMVGLASSCVHERRKDRPNLLEVVAELQMIEKDLVTAASSSDIPSPHDIPSSGYLTASQNLRTAAVKSFPSEVPIYIA